MQDMAAPVNLCVNVCHHIVRFLFSFTDQKLFKIRCNKGTQKKMPLNAPRTPAKWRVVTAPLEAQVTLLASRGQCSPYLSFRYCAPDVVAWCEGNLLHQYTDWYMQLWVQTRRLQTRCGKWRPTGRHQGWGLDVLQLEPFLGPLRWLQSWVPGQLWRLQLGQWWTAYWLEDPAHSWGMWNPHQMSLYHEASWAN